MIESRIVRLEVDDAIEAAKDLNEYVVCLDRIFSRLGTGDYGDEILIDYLVQRDVMRRLARLREKIFDALDEVIGPEESERIAEESYVYQDPER
jgi:hypothetical protein